MRRLDNFERGPRTVSPTDRQSWKHRLGFRPA